MAGGAIQRPQSRYRPFIGEDSNALPKRNSRPYSKIFIRLLDVQGLLEPAADAMTDHQARELVPIDEDDAIAQLIGCLTCRR
jgi:hypothetical protein